MNYKKMSYISGIVIFFGIIILMITIITLSGKRIFFTRDYIVYAKFSDVIGLEDQAKVYMRGYRIGWTKDVQFRDKYVIVRIDINKKFKIPEDSKFEINTISLLGEKAITISPGKSDRYLKPGSVVEGQNHDIIAQAKSILLMVKSSLQKGDLDARIRQLSESIDSFHHLLARMNKKVDALQIEEYNRDIHQLGEAGRTATRVLGRTSDSLMTSMQNFNETLTELTLLSQQLTAIAAKINQGQGSAGALVNDKTYIENVNRMVTELNALIADLKKNPGKYVKLSIF